MHETTPTRGLAPEPLDLLTKRAEIGEDAINAAWGREPEHPDDRRAAASDVISDVLTAMFGPSGYHDPERGLCRYLAANENAQELLDAAYRSWRGDAEDYYKPETTNPLEAHGASRRV